MSLLFFSLKSVRTNKWYNGLVPEYKRNPNTQCVQCANRIYRRPGELQRSRGRAFCSQFCYGISQRKETPCVVCSAPILASANKKTCSRTCANKNRTGLKYHRGNPKSKVVYQRGLKIRLLNLRGHRCERCDYDKIEILQVHYKDRNRQHNELSNLELICPNCHAEEHYLENSWLNGKVRT